MHPGAQVPHNPQLPYLTSTRPISNVNTPVCFLPQGPGTDRTEIRRMMAAVREFKPVTIDRLINYDKTKVPFLQTLSLVPVSSPCGGTFYRASTTAVSRLGLPQVTRTNLLLYRKTHLL